MTRIEPVRHRVDGNTIKFDQPVVLAAGVGIRISQTIAFDSEGAAVIEKSKVMKVTHDPE